MIFTKNTDTWPGNALARQGKARQGKETKSLPNEKQTSEIPGYLSHGWHK